MSAAGASPTPGGIRPREAQTLRSWERSQRRSVGGRVRGPGDRAPKRSIRKEPTPFLEAEGHDEAANEAERAAKFPRGRMSSARTHKPHAREPGDLGGASPEKSAGTQLREGRSRNTQPPTSEESDASIVAQKLGNSRVTH